MATPWETRGKKHQNPLALNASPQKKVLSLVLCVAVMLSVMVLGAGAAFSDQDKIENTEAVDATTALNIIGGYEDGSFHPERNIKRSEVTKMICVALNGGKEPNLATPAVPTFSDVRGTSDGWAEKYIESCVAQGIVSGVGDNRFSPAGNVTGSQLAKMLLVAIGYDADIEHFTGNAWETNVNVVATQKGLYKGLEAMDVSAAVTRDQAAQMVWNALKAIEVEYKYTLVSENGQLVSKVTIENKANNRAGDADGLMSLLEDKYNAEIRDGGIVTKVKEDNKGTYTVTVSTTGKTPMYTEVKTNYVDLIGQKVDVLVKISDGTVYGIYANKDSKVLASGAVGQLDTVSSDAKKMKLDGVEYKFESAALSQSVAYTNTITTGTLSTVNASKHANAANEIKFIDNNGDGKVDSVTVTPATVVEVTYVGSTSITAGNKSYKFEDDDIYKGVAKNDWAIIVAGDYTVTDNAVITKADTINGEVTGVRTGTPNEVMIDSVWYKMASGTQTPAVGDKGTFVVVHGYIYDADVSGSSKDILYISANEDGETKLGNDVTVEAKAYFTDGTNKEIKIDKINGKDLVVPDPAGTSNLANMKIAKDALKGQMFTYSIDSDGNYELKQLANADAVAGTEAVVGDTSGSKDAGKIGGATAIKENKAGYDSYLYDKGKYVSPNNKLDSGSIADDAVIFVQANTEVKVLSGKTVKDWNTAAGNFTGKGVLTSESNGIQYAKIAAMTVDTATVPGANGDKLYGYLTADPYTTKYEGDDVVAYTIWTGSENTTVYEKGTTIIGGVKAGDAIQYHVDGNYIATDAALTDENNAYAITGFDYEAEGEMALVKYANGSTVSATLDEDCVFIGIDDSAKAGVEGDMSAVSLAQQDQYGNYYANAYVVVSAGKVLAVIFDNDKLDIADGGLAMAGYTVTNSNASISASGDSGAYTVTVNPTSNVKPGATVTVSVECTTAPQNSKTDTVTVKVGSDTVGTLTFTTTGTQTASFTMGNAACSVATTVATA